VLRPRKRREHRRRRADRLWLWFTVLFANFAEALAEGRGKARADSLKAGSQGLTAQRRKRDGSYETVPPASCARTMWCAWWPAR
jgi:high-affinity K+ transport system ATPase subunit B